MALAHAPFLCAPPLGGCFPSSSPSDSVVEVADSFEITSIWNVLTVPTVPASTDRLKARESIAERRWGGGRAGWQAAVPGAPERPPPACKEVGGDASSEDSQVAACLAPYNTSRQLLLGRCAAACLFGYPACAYFQLSTEVPFLEWEPPVPTAPVFTCQLWDWPTTNNGSSGADGGAGAAYPAAPTARPSFIAELHSIGYGRECIHAVLLSMPTSLGTPPPPPVLPLLCSAVPSRAPAPVRLPPTSDDSAPQKRQLQWRPLTPGTFTAPPTGLGNSTSCTEVPAELADSREPTSVEPCCQNLQAFDGDTCIECG